ncbi:MAG: 50S ribosomal protein L1 [Methylacidiphilales bacterium]|nr:50S ribosomal protein L1 [Candidatus Methylacidiphilales bacterium]MDW8350129.1 50S ribosomal protein L1 [Verrucomicrobiae bacterium]
MAKKHSKRYLAALKKYDPQKHYSLSEAVKILKTFPKGKTDETVDLSFRLGVDPKQSDQMVRGTVTLPNGSGKSVKVLVFAKGAAADAAKAAGAEYVGFEDLIKKVSEGFQDFDVAIATPDAMNEVRKLGKILGPKGLMPNPKTGTVTTDTAAAVKACKAGRVEFKLDKSGNVHTYIGKASFEERALTENAQATIDALSKAKPASSKGRFILNCAISTTFSPSIKIALQN